MNMTSAVGEPSPKTVWVAFRKRPQPRHPAAASVRLLSDGRSGMSDRASVGSSVLGIGRLPRTGRSPPYPPEWVVLLHRDGSGGIRRFGAWDYSGLVSPRGWGNPLTGLSVRPSGRRGRRTECHSSLAAMRTPARNDGR